MCLRAHFKENVFFLVTYGVIYLRCDGRELAAGLLVLAGLDHAQPALPHHLTPAVLIGHPGGHAHAAGPRAGLPLGGLLDAVQSGVPRVKAYRRLLAKGWFQRKVHQ